MSRQVSLRDDWTSRIERLTPDKDGKPRFKVDFWNEPANDAGAEMYLSIDDMYLIRNMINSELDDAYVPIVVDPEDAA